MDKELLHKFFNNQTSTQEEESILRWVKESDANNKELISERKLYDHMLMIPDDKILNLRTGSVKLHNLARQALRYAAVILATVGVSVYYMSHRQTDALMATNTISVPAGQHVNVVLPDGTKVCVNAMSTLEYPVSFARKNRNVKLTGEAFFDVTHDKRKPFIVNTFACNVEVLGTKFNVAAHPAQKEFVTSLIEGRVKLTDNANPKMSVILSPNQQASYIDSRLIVSTIPEYEDFQWRKGILAFHDATVTKLIGEFKRYYGIDIKVDPHRVFTNLFTGKIRISEGIEQAMWALQQNCSFRYHWNETKDIIYIE